MTRVARRARGARAATIEGPVSVESAPHYVWGASCDGWRLLDCGDLSVIEERMPPGTHERRHVHRHSLQFFYVRSGCLTIECRGRAARLRAGDGLHVPPGVAHRVSNRGREDTLFLVVSSPSTAGDRIEVGRPRTGAQHRSLA